MVVHHEIDLWPTARLEEMRWSGTAASPLKYIAVHYFCGPFKRRSLAVASIHVPFSDANAQVHASA